MPVVVSLTFRAKKCGAYTLELEVSSMSTWSVSLALQHNEDDGAHYRDEVERQVHKVADDGLRRELRKWLGDQFAQARNSVSSSGTFDLTLLSHKFGLAAGDKSAVEGVDQAVLDKESLGEDHGKSATLTQHQ